MLWKSETNLSQTMCLATGPMLSLWQKPGTNFMVQDKFVSDFHCSDRFKGFFNLSQTMKFGTGFLPMLSLWQKSGTNFMVRDKLKTL